MQTTVPEFRIGAAMGGDPKARFARVSRVLVLADGDRIVAAEGHGARVTIWTPDGNLVAEIAGHGEGPGEFGGIFFLHRFSNGFLTRGTERFTLFSDDGALIETVQFPRTSLSFRGFHLAPEVLLGDGTVFAIPSVPAEIMLGNLGDDPIPTLPLLRLSKDDDQWSMDTVATLDYRNRHLISEKGGGGIQTGQPLGDYDLTYFDPASGSVVVVERSAGDGRVALTEINADGDTLWRQRILMPSVSPTSEMTASFVDAYVQMGWTRDQIVDALYIPDPLPGALKARGTASGEVWLASFEAMDTFVVWYAVRRGGDSTDVRTVLLPRGFALSDATDTHVWGVEKDELGVNYVTGRRILTGVDEEVSAVDAASPVEDAASAVETDLPDDDGATGAESRSWTTRTDYRIEDPDEGAEGFERFARMRASPDGGHIVATDGLRSGRVRVLSRDGTLVREVGRDELASGELIGVWTSSDGFWAREYLAGRVSGYRYEGGMAIDTFSLPAGMEHFTPVPQGGLIGKAELPDFDWKRLHQALEEQAVVNVNVIGEEEDRDTIFALDVRHLDWMVGIRGEGSRYPTQVYLRQPFADHDLTWFDPVRGSVVVVRRSGSPGVVELFEVLATGDTAWHRRLDLPSVELSEEEVDLAIEGVLATLRRAADSGGHVLSDAELRGVVDSVVHVPSHLPVVARVVASSAGDVCTIDGLSVWYSIRRGDDEATPRRVLVPSSFQFKDASETHIWGMSTSGAGERVIRGLALVPH
ncbi:MAG: hypothetical protein J4F34_00800 [Gemmatimonadetes bacterium]|nr:hypothetical protein [Gemmatimonadota bacterium]